MEAITAFVDQYGLLMAQGTWDTIVMTVLSTLFAYVIGIPLGVLLILTAPGGLHPRVQQRTGLARQYRTLYPVHYLDRVHDSVHARHCWHVAGRGRCDCAPHGGGRAVRGPHGGAEPG